MLAASQKGWIYADLNGFLFSVQQNTAQRRRQGIVNRLRLSDLVIVWLGLLFILLVFICAVLFVAFLRRKLVLFSDRLCGTIRRRS